MFGIAPESHDQIEKNGGISSPVALPRQSKCAHSVTRMNGWKVRMKSITFSFYGGNSESCRKLADHLTKPRLL